MLFLLTVITLAQSKPTDLFDACEAGLRSIKAYSVHIDAAASKAGQTKRMQFDLSVSPTQAYMRQQEPASGFLDRSDRRYSLRGDKLVGYDAIADERIHRTVKEGKTPAAKLAGALGTEDLSLNVVLDPTAMRGFFQGFRLFNDWRITKNGDTVRIERFPKGGSTMFRFSGSRHLLSEALLKTNGSSIHWNFDFQAGAKIALTIPDDARPVVSFSQREAPPKYKSPEAKEVVEKMLKAYGAFRNGTVDIKSDEGSLHLVISGRRLIEKNSLFEWAYDGTSLSIKNHRTGGYYRGKAKRVIISEYVAVLGGEVDPLIRPMLAQRLPYLDLFPSTGVVRLIGSLGTQADILEVKSSTLKVSLFVRRDNHLLDSMESETVDRPGRVQTRNQRWFTYSRLGEPTDVANFRLLPGKANIQPLPKHKILGETQ
jgi:hypothetical protein